MFRNGELSEVLPKNSQIHSLRQQLFYKAGKHPLQQGFFWLPSENKAKGEDNWE